MSGTLTSESSSSNGVDDFGDNSIIAEGGNGQHENELHSDFGPFGLSFSSSDIDLFDELSSFLKYPQEEHPLESFSGFELFDDIVNDLLLPAAEACELQIANPGEIPARTLDISEPNQKSRQPFSLASLEVLKRHGTGFRRLNKPRKSESLSKNEPTTRLSTHEIVWTAAERFVHSSSQKPGDHFDLSLSGLSNEEIDNIELVCFLLDSADKITSQEFERATILLSLCDLLSSKVGNPVQRVVYHFSEALREKIVRVSKVLGKRTLLDSSVVKEPHTHINIGYYQEVPFSQVVEFAAIQSIVENVGDAKTIHILDFCVRCGVQWTLLMQALKSRCESHLELLKITVVGSSDTKSMEETGNRLISFAETMKLPLSFKVIKVSDILNLSKDDFEVNDKETVVVYSIVFASSLLSKPDRLNHLMGLLRIVNPCIMVVAEVESNNNSSCFMTRFVETLFYFSAYFDSLDACMGTEDPNRVEMESLFSIGGIRNIVSNEREERTVRHVKIDVWRAFFSRLGMEEREFSSNSLFHAEEMVKKVPSWSCCTLDMDEKCLIIGWKGTPIHSLSLWKFIDYSSE